MAEISRDLSESSFSQRYRPQRPDELVADDDVRAKVVELCSDPDKLQSILFAGPPGIGKTTVAKMIAKLLGADFIFLNMSGQDRGVETVRSRVVQYGSTVSLDGAPKVVIGDEADKLTMDAQDAMRSTMEAVSKTTTFFLTANYPGRLSDPFKSRLQLVDLTVKDKKSGMAQIAKRCVQICQVEGIDFDKDAIKEIVRICYPDLRKTVDTLGWHGKTGRIDMGTVERVRRASVEGLVGLFREKKFTKMVEWVYENVESESDFVGELWTKALTIWTPATIPSAAFHLNKCQVELATVADKKLCLLAALAMIGRECELVEGA